MGITFKENCKDIKNSKSLQIYEILSDYGFNIKVYDPVANLVEVRKKFGIELVEQNALNKANIYLISVGHQQFEMTF